MKIQKELALQLIKCSHVFSREFHSNPVGTYHLHFTAE